MTETAFNMIKQEQEELNAKKEILIEILKALQPKSKK